MVGSKIFAYSIMNYTWIAREPVQYLHQFQGEQPPGDVKDLELQHSALEIWNCFLSKFLIFILNPEASSGLNHRLPNWKWISINQHLILKINDIRDIASSISNGGKYHC